MSTINQKAVLTDIFNTVFNGMSAAIIVSGIGGVEVSGVDMVKEGYKLHIAHGEEGAVILTPAFMIAGIQFEYDGNDHCGYIVDIDIVRYFFTFLAKDRVEYDTDLCSIDPKIQYQQQLDRFEKLLVTLNY